jgi:hypothetical protein
MKIAYFLSVLSGFEELKKPAIPKVLPFSKFGGQNILPWITRNLNLHICRWQVIVAFSTFVQVTLPPLYLPVCPSKVYPQSSQSQAKCSQALV